MNPGPETDCIVVGGGPAGIILGYLLASQGLQVRVLESQPDFDRSFRGDTLHPSTMELLDQLGLADAVLELPHTLMDSVQLNTPEGPITTVDFGALEGRTRFPWVALVAQPDLLAAIAEHGQRQFSNLNIQMNTVVRGLVFADGDPRRQVIGVECEQGKDRLTMEARVVVGADGRSSGVRRAAGLEIHKTKTPMDVLWFELQKADGGQNVSAPLMGNVAPGQISVRFDRGDHWQVGLIIPKGSFRDVKGAGLESFRATVANLDPDVAALVQQITDWNQVALLTVAAGRVRKWYRDGLLLIGDAAHIMSPVGGVGINYAVQDAVTAANILAPALAAGRVSTAHLARIQRRRLLPTMFIQAVQEQIQKNLVARALGADGEFRIPFFLRGPVQWIRKVPLLRRIPPTLIGFGLMRSRLKLPVPESV